MSAQQATENLPLILLPNSNDSSSFFLSRAQLNAVGITLFYSLLYHEAPVITTLSMMQELLTYRALLDYINEENFDEIVTKQLPNTHIKFWATGPLKTSLQIAKGFIDITRYLSSKNQSQPITLVPIIDGLIKGNALESLVPGTLQEKTDLISKLSAQFQDPELIKQFLETTFDPSKSLPDELIAQTYFFPLYFLLQPHLWYYYLITQDDNYSEAIIALVPRSPDISEQATLEKFGLPSSLQEHKITDQNILNRNILKTEEKMAKSLISWLKKSLKGMLTQQDFDNHYSWMIYILAHGDYEKRQQIIKPTIGIFHDEDAADFLSVFDHYPVRLLYLQSCFIGDEALPAVFGKESLTIKAHPYPIISSALTAALSGIPRIPFYLKDFSFNTLKTGEILIKNIVQEKAIFNSFFALTKQSPLEFQKITDLFKPPYHAQENIAYYHPTIKLPNTQWFLPIDSDLASITKVMASTQETPYKPLIKKEGTLLAPLALLLYTPYVPFPLIVPEGTKAIISMVPGDAIHAFKELRFEGIKTIQNIFDYFAGITSLKPEKIFFIEKLLWQEKRMGSSLDTMQHESYNVLIVTGGFEVHDLFLSMIDENGNEMNFEIKNWMTREIAQVSKKEPREKYLKLVKEFEPQAQLINVESIKQALHKKLETVLQENLIALHNKMKSLLAQLSAQK